MKAPAPPVLTLAAFPLARTPYIRPERDLLALPFFDNAHPPVLYLPVENELAPLFDKLLHESQSAFFNQAEVLRTYLALILKIATRHYPAVPAGTEAFTHSAFSPSPACYPTKKPGATSSAGLFL